MQEQAQHTTFSGDALSAKPARDVVGLLKRGDVSSADLIDICLTRLAQTDGTVNACPTLCEARAREAASRLSAAQRATSILAGLPINIKDLSAVSGVRTTWGTIGHADFVPQASDPIVTRLEDAGGIVLAKTNTPEFGAGANTFNAVFGPTRNPWNPALNAGGSSGGAAVSLATGQFWLAHGSDHAGSLRTPAAYNRVVGLRPSPGRVPSGGALGYMREGAQGPMARDVEDCALFLDAMVGFEPGNPLSFPAADRPFSDSTPCIEWGPKIAYSPTLNGYAPVEAEIRDVLDRALGTAGRSGAQIEDACPDLSNLEKTYRVLRGRLWAASVGRLADDIGAHLKATLKENLAFGRALTIDDISDAELDRMVIFSNMAAFLETFDVLATAVVGCAPKPVEIEYPTDVAGVPMNDYISWLKFAFLSTTTGLPSISVPVGFTPSGLPVGLQLIGPHRGEAKLLQVANFIEKAVGLDLGPIDPKAAHDPLT